jgi:putative tricarboxylic transport membrane protein
VSAFLTLIVAILVFRSSLALTDVIASTSFIDLAQAIRPTATDPPYYEGKAIQLIVAFAPGGVTDNSARLVGRYLGKHIPGNPIMIV